MESRLKCCDPYKIHKKIVRSSLRQINEKDVPPGLKHIVGQFWCVNCLKRASGTSLSAAVTEDEIIEHSSKEPGGDGIEEPASGISNVTPQAEPEHEEIGSKVEEGQSSCSFAVKKTVSCSLEDKLFPYSSLSKPEAAALAWASGIKIIAADACVCESHYEYFVGVSKTEDVKISGRCCDPMQRHKNFVKAGIREISALGVVKAREKNIILHAGNFLCDSCRKEINNLPLSSPSLSQVSEEIVLSGASSHALGLSPAVIKEELQHDLQGLGLTPIESISGSKREKIQYAKRKLEDVSEVIRKKLCRAIDINEDDLLSSENELSSLGHQYSAIIAEIKGKLQNADRKTQIQLLTMCPSSWSTNYAANYFGVSRYLVDRARSLRANHGVLSIPDYQFKSNLYVPHEIRKLVQDFYCDNNYSRIMPGKKDCVSLGRGHHEQKRLILCNLKELYKEFKETNPTVKIGLSLFCSLRPKWCVIAGAYGTHNVCVCVTHQNAKLLLRALGIKDSLSELIPDLVCDSNDPDCMLSVCPKCPTLAQISEKVRCKIQKIWSEQFPEANEEDDLDSFQDFLVDNIEYKEWTSTDRAELSTKVCKVSDLIDILASKLKDLVSHDFIAKQQSSYLKREKENLDPTKAIILMDFSMNYTCIVQDASQSYHWSKKGCTVHPVVIYLKGPDGNLIHKSLCFISDDVNHDVSLVKKFQAEIIQYIKENFPMISEVMYVSDGSAAQYKNCKSFLNLCEHQNMYGMKASWCFFASSHGKSPCDGIGGLVKREASKASLQRPYKDQILDAEKLFNFCQSQLSKAIKFFYVKSSDMAAQRVNDANLQPTTVPGTRSFHHFIPLPGDKPTIGCKRISYDNEFSLEYNLCPEEKLDESELVIGGYVAVMIRTKIRVGLITDVNLIDKEAELLLLEPAIPSSVFSWPQNMSNCYVAPFPHIVCPVTLQENENMIFEIVLSDILKIRQIASIKRKQQKL